MKIQALVPVLSTERAYDEVLALVWFEVEP
jgi:hypothetical protein